MKRFVRLLMLMLCCLTGGWATAQYTTTYEYDELNRLVKVDYPNGQRVELEYDALGNRTVKTITQMGYAISVQVQPAGSGTVQGAGVVGIGATANLLATPKYGFAFVNWTEEGEVVSTEATYAFTVSGPRNLVANFEVCSVTQTSQLVAGWNWWAPTVETDVEAVQTALGSNLLHIVSYTGNRDATDNLVPGQMYKIQVSTTCTLTLSGLVPSSVEVAIANGYNWFGFTGLETATITETFAGFNPAAGDKVVSQDGGFAIFNGSAWTGTLTTLYPGRGYVYVSKASGSKTVTF